MTAFRQLCLTINLIVRQGSHFVLIQNQKIGFGVHLRAGTKKQIIPSSTDQHNCLMLQRWHDTTVIPIGETVCNEIVQELTHVWTITTSATSCSDFQITLSSTLRALIQFRSFFLPVVKSFTITARSYSSPSTVYATYVSVSPSILIT